MNRMAPPKVRLLHLVAAALIAFQSANHARAQPTFSIDAQGPTVGGGAVTEGDILTAIGTSMGSPPIAIVPAGGAGLAIGATPAGHVELDALSYGLDPRLDPAVSTSNDWFFSVDEFAVGLPGVAAPSVTSEGALGKAEASGDIYTTATSSAAPIPPFVPGLNSLIIDADGSPFPGLGPGLNLFEPNPPTIATLPDTGDNVDAFDLDTPLHILFPLPVYFSLDGSTTDPIEFPAGLPAFPNLGTATANSVLPGDILVTAAPGPLTVYAPAVTLGLDIAAPGGVTALPDPGTDVDALVLWDDGDAVYQPTTGPYSWLPGGPLPPTDMLLFSIRRGSSYIGAIDVLQGLPIEEGDILIPVFDPVDGVLVQDGIEGDFDVGIYIAAEALGLATVRSGVPLFGALGHGDDLTALDVLQAVIPEPATLAMLAVGVVLVTRRRTQRT